MRDPNDFNNNSTNPADWSTDKQWAEALDQNYKARTEASRQPGPRVPVWAGIGTIGFSALVGFILGMFFGHGSWTIGAVTAAAFAGVNLLFRVAFKGGEGGNHALQYAAIGFIGGFVLSIASVFIGVNSRPFDVAIIGAVVGAIVGFLRKR